MRMLCARPAPVKYEGNGPEDDRHAQTRQPNLHELRTPIALGRDADVVATGEVDLRRKEGSGKAQQRQGGADAGDA